MTRCGNPVGGDRETPPDQALPALGCTPGRATSHHETSPPRCDLGGLPRLDAPARAGKYPRTGRPGRGGRPRCPGASQTSRAHLQRSVYVRDELRTCRRAAARELGSGPSLTLPLHRVVGRRSDRGVASALGPPAPSRAVQLGGDALSIADGAVAVNGACRPCSLLTRGRARPGARARPRDPSPPAARRLAWSRLGQGQVFQPLTKNLAL